MFLKYRVCFGPLLEYGLTYDQADEVSMGVSTEGCMQ